MKPDSSDPLLTAVLADDDAWRAATLRQTLALARRRRHVRTAVRAVAATFVLVAAVLSLHPPPHPPASRRPAATPPFVTVRTAPLAQNKLVRTRRAFFTPIASTATGLAIVETRTAAPVLDYLSDQQLLAAFPSEHPALIAPGTDGARLVFY